MLQTDGSLHRADHNAGSAVITFSRIHHNRRMSFALLSRRNQNIALTYTGTASAAYAKTGVKPDRTRAAGNRADGIFDLFQVNEALYEFDQVTL